jgi:hypothetical protein
LHDVRSAHEKGAAKIRRPAKSGKHLNEYHINDRSPADRKKGIAPPKVEHADRRDRNYLRRAVISGDKIHIAQAVHDKRGDDRRRQYPAEIIDRLRDLPLAEGGKGDDSRKKRRCGGDRHYKYRIPEGSVHFLFLDFYFHFAARFIPVAARGPYLTDRTRRAEFHEKTLKIPLRGDFAHDLV